MNKIIHQFWHNNDIPDIYFLNIQTTKKLYSDWEHLLWNEDKALALIKNNTQIFDFAKTLKGVELYDFLRLCILDFYGGLYLDIDTKPLSKMPDQLFSKEATFAEHNDFSILPFSAFKYKINNNFLYFKKESLILKKIMYYVPKMQFSKIYYSRPFSTCGYLFLDFILNKKFTEAYIEKNCIILNDASFANHFNHLFDKKWFTPSLSYV